MAIVAAVVVGGFLLYGLGHFQSWEAQPRAPYFNPVLLAEYHNSMKTRIFNPEGFEFRTMARAAELARQKGVLITPQSRVVFQSIWRVPVAVFVDMKPVPIGENDYTEDERKMLDTYHMLRETIEKEAVRARRNDQLSPERKTNSDAGVFLWH